MIDNKNTFDTAILAVMQAITFGTGNGKTGAAFSLPNIATCPGSTELCRSLCYAGLGRMAIHQGTDGTYDRKRKAAIKLMATNPELLVLALIAAWNALPKWAQKRATLRVHDSGDFFSPTYVRCWAEFAKRMPHVQLWFYTRSWRVGGALAEELRNLAALPNVAGWVSCDDECALPAIIEARDERWAGIAYMQTSEDTSGMHAVAQKAVGKSRFINFPIHGAFGKDLIEHDNTMRNCPAITGAIDVPRKSNGSTPAACQACKMCLPSATV